MERTMSTQSPVFPLPLVTQILSSPDVKSIFLGTETVGSAICSHIQTWNSFDSYPRVVFLSEYTRKDIWIENQTGLIRRLSFEKRDAGGAVPRTLMDVYYLDYRTVGTVLYPFNVTESMNGTPWLTISIQNVAVNAGLTDSAFPIQ
jgi:hypothetical protein